MTCTVTDPGYPQAMFEWSKDGNVKSPNNKGIYSIPSGTLSVSAHDGLWQCTPVNVAGRGDSATIKLTVYGKLLNICCILFIWYYPDTFKG